MNKKHLFLLFILLAQLTTSDCQAYDAFYSDIDKIDKDVIASCVLCLFAGTCYATYKIYNIYQERQKRLKIAARNSSQVIEEATTFYKNAIYYYKKPIEYLLEKETSESNIIKHIILSHPEYPYPFMFAHDYIQKRLVPTILQHKKWIQEKIDQGEITENSLEETQVFLNNLDSLTNNLREIDQIVIFSNQFNEEKKHKYLVDSTFANKPPMIVYMPR